MPISKVVSSLRQKGILKPLVSGTYAYAGIENGPHGGGVVYPQKVAQLLFPAGNYYIGYSSAYHYHHYTEQVVIVTCILNTLYQAKRIIQKQTYDLYKVNDNRMYGIEKHKLPDGTIVNYSDKERTLVDVFYKPEIVEFNRIEEILVEQIFDLKEVNLDKFLEYAIRFPIIITRKRIGYYLEKIGIPAAKLEQLQATIKDSRKDLLYDQATYSIKHTKGDFISKWRLIKNVR